MTTPSNPAPTPEPSLETKIADLEGKLKDQDQADAKGHLASVKKISDEVAQAILSYDKGFKDLVFDRSKSKSYVKLAQTELAKEVIKKDRDRIDEIAKSYDTNVTSLKAKWNKAHTDLKTAQSDYDTAQDKFGVEEANYRGALKFRAVQDDLDALETQSGKELDAQRFRPAYFLVHDMDAAANTTVKPVKDYSDKLKDTATVYEAAENDRRVKKFLLDKGTAAEKDAKKAYEDAVAKRRENILKLIADEPFPPPSADTDTTADADAGDEAAAEETAV